MLIPEIILTKTIKGILKLVNDDWTAKTDKSKTILALLFKKDQNDEILQLEKFVWYDEAQAILIKNPGNARQVEVSVGYNLERKGLPTIHVLLPQEATGPNSIGFGEGYNEGIYDEAASEYTRNFSYSFQTTYALMITSENAQEAILLYNFFKMMFVALFETLELSGLRNISFNGADLTFNNDLALPYIFHRNLNISFFYESSVHDVIIQKVGKKFKFSND